MMDKCDVNSFELAVKPATSSNYMKTRAGAENILERFVYTCTLLVALCQIMSWILVQAFYSSYLAVTLGGANQGTEVNVAVVETACWTALFVSAVALCFLVAMAMLLAQNLAFPLTSSTGAQLAMLLHIIVSLFVVTGFLAGTKMSGRINTFAGLHQLLLFLIVAFDGLCIILHVAYDRRQSKNKRTAMKIEDLFQIAMPREKRFVFEV